AHAHYAQLRYPRSYTLPTIQQQIIDPDEVLLEYMIGEQQSFVFVVTQDQFETVPLPGRAEIESNVKLYLGLINNNPQKLGPHMEKAFGDTYRQGHKLYRMLFAGVKTRLPSKWIVVADGVLHYMPFEALVEEFQEPPAPANKKRGEPVRYVAEDYTIAYAPSA